MMSDFWPGQKVVCLTNIWNRKNGEWVPVKHGIYTVRDVTFYGIEGLRLMEIVNEPRQYAQGFAEATFVSACFRPIEKKSDPIGIFKQMCVSPKPLVPVRASHSANVSEG